MKYQVVFSEEIVWCPNDDRHILIKRANGEIEGINYAQGDDLEYFLENFNEIDHDLTDFYKAIKPYLDERNDEIEGINGAIWAYHEYEVLRSDRAYKKLNK